MTIFYLSSMTKPVNLVLLLIGIGSLVGCSGGSLLTSEGIQASDWARPVTPFQPPQLYCYRTLAQTECYAHPQPGLEDRLVAFYPDPPKTRGCRKAKATCP